MIQFFSALTLVYMLPEVLYEKKTFLEVLQNLQENTCATPGLRPATLLEKRLWHKCFSVNFAKFLGTPLLQNISGRLLLFFLYSQDSVCSTSLGISRFSDKIFSFFTWLLFSYCFLLGNRSLIFFRNFGFHKSWMHRCFQGTQCNFLIKGTLMQI